MKLSFWVFALFLSTSTLFAQSYQTAVGLRLGNEWGITAKQHLGNNYALEFLAITQKAEFENKLALYIERHYNLMGRRFNGYVGAGIHKGFSRSVLALGTSSSYGVGAIGGVEFSSGSYNFSLDLRPQFNLNKLATPNFYNSYIGLSVRYILIKRDTKFQEWKKRKLSKNKKS
jgi:hypothetical protein